MNPDGTEEVVAADNYSLEEGSTIIKMKAKFLNQKTEGSYTLKAVFSKPSDADPKVMEKKTTEIKFFVKKAPVANASPAPASENKSSDPAPAATPETKAAETPAKPATTKAPKTSDLFTEAYLAMSILGAGGLTWAAAKRKKK